MIDAIDNILVNFYYKPLRLLVMTIIPVIIGFSLFAFAPQIDQESVFYLPLLRVHYIGIGFAVIGMTLSLIFYAQHNTALRSMGVFGIVALLLAGPMLVMQNDAFVDVQHHDTINADGNVYHLGAVNDVSTEYLLQAYVLYECGRFGIFCERIAHNLIPSISESGDFQNVALLRIDEAGVIRVLDGGNPQPLFEYTPE
jgi:hypothetical protein